VPGRFSYLQEGLAPHEHSCEHFAAVTECLCPAAGVHILVLPAWPYMAHGLLHLHLGPQGKVILLTIPASFASSDNRQTVITLPRQVFRIMRRFFCPLNSPVSHTAGVRGAAVGLAGDGPRGAHPRGGEAA